MSEPLRRRAERLKLARLLGVEADDLPALDGVPSADLAVFRERATDRLFDESARVLGRAGLAARLVPTPVVVTIATKVFGPWLCARAAAAIDPGKAVDVASRLPADFLADVTVELDPRRVADVIAGVPESLAVPVAVELGRRREHVTMGRFLAFVPDGPLQRAMEVLDDEAILRTAFVLEHMDRLDHAVGLLAPARVPGVLRCAAEHGLWPEVLDLVSHLSLPRQAAVIDLVAALGGDVVDSLVGAVCEADLWPSLLPVVRLASPESCRLLARAPAFHSDRALRGVVSTADTDELWADLASFVDALPAEARTRLAALAAHA